MKDEEKARFGAWADMATARRIGDARVSSWVGGEPLAGDPGSANSIRVTKWVESLWAAVVRVAFPASNRLDGLPGEEGDVAEEEGMTFADDGEDSTISAAGAPAPAEQAPDLGWRPVGAAPRDPGWYPTGTNPNEQAYWDGGAWTRRRRWTVSGWIEEGINPVAPAATSVPRPPRFSAQPHAQSFAPPLAASRRPASSSPTLTLGMLVLLASGILLMVGSDMSWVSASLSAGARSATIGGPPGLGVSYGVNGFAVFICGIVLVALTAALMANDDWALRVLSLVAAWTALGFAFYFLVRILNDINDNRSSFAHANVGVGLIIVLCAAVAGAAVTALRMRSL